MEIRPILSAVRRSKTGAILIATQVALTLAVSTNALSIVQDRLALANRPTGLVEDELFMIRLWPFRPIADVETMQRDDVRALAAIPGVKSAAWANQVPLSRSGWSSGLGSERDQLETISAAVYFSPDSLIETLGLQLLEGRDFTEDEVVAIDPGTDSTPARAVIVTRALARRLFPDHDAVVGRTLYQGSGDAAEPATIVGVVERLQAPWAPPGVQAEYSAIYPERSLGPGPTTYFVRTEAGALDQVMAEAERRLATRIDGRVLIANRALEDVRERYYRSHRALAGILVAVSGLLLVVTASGIVGMASLWVNQRRKQIGVRRALGAMRRDVVRYFLVENFLVTSAGLVVGVALALGLNELLVSELEMVRLPWRYLMVGVGSVWLLGLAAAFGPAWRASLISPAIATRSV